MGTLFPVFFFKPHRKGVPTAMEGIKEYATVSNPLTEASSQETSKLS